MSESTRRRWLLVALAVTLAHLLVISGAVRFLGGILFMDPAREPTLISAQMLAPPVQPARPVRPPAPPTPAFVPAPAADSATAEPTEQAQDAVETEQAALQEPQVLAETRLKDRQPLAEELPQTGAIAIDAYWGDFKDGSPIARGSIEISFPEPDRYQIRLVTKAQGWAAIFAPKPLQAETSGRLGPGGFRPDRYTHVTPRGKEEVTQFDYQANTVTYSSIKEPFALPAGIQDRLSFMLQLAWMMKVAPERFTLGESVTVPMAGRKAIEEVSFMVLSDQPLVLPGGILVPAVHLSSYQVRDRFSGRIDVWLDQADRLLPVRIRFEESRGQVVDLLAIRQP
jgi:hypothetical protein